MRGTIATVLAMATVGTASVRAQVDHCTELLRLSRTTARTVMDRSQFTRTVDNFCDETRSARSSNRSLNLDLRVLGIGAGGGSASSTNSAYTKYCSDESDERRDESNYQQYLEGLAPGTHAAYAACTTAASNEVQFEMLTAPTRDLLELVVFHETNRPSAVADMSWSASDPVTCQWESFRADGEVEAPQQRVLEANERTRLRCRRDSFNAEPVQEPDFVNVIRNGGNATVNIPWSKYNGQGEPYETLEEIQQQLDAEVASLRNAVSELGERAQALEEDPDTIPQFGGWVGNSRVNTNYRAEADGFVVLFSRGGIADILAGPESNPTTIRTRLAKDGGVVLPVPKGHSWRVQWPSNGGRIQFQWMPVAPTNP